MTWQLNFDKPPIPEIVDSQRWNLGGAAIYLTDSHCDNVRLMTYQVFTWGPQAIMFINI